MCVCVFSFLLFLSLLQQVQISDDFCGMEVNTPLDGAMAIEASPVLTYPSTLLTAVSAVSTHDYTVTFLGTSDGHLKKVSFSSHTPQPSQSFIYIYIFDSW